MRQGETILSRRGSAVPGARAETPSSEPADRVSRKPAIHLSRDDAGFPSRLLPLPLRLEALWMRSELDGASLQELWNRPAVAVVGARAASPAGLEIARSLGWDLARAGVVVVSGMARGIDAAAHEGALLAGGWTVAILGCGIEVCYPPEHEPLAKRIAAHGAVISEWAGAFQPRPGCFPARNRLISGLSDVVVLVEGAASSGALHTVRFALDFGREVMAVPRDPTLPGSRAPNRLLKQGAAPAVGAADVIAALSSLSPAPADAAAGPGASAAALDPGASSSREDGSPCDDSSACAAAPPRKSAFSRQPAARRRRVAREQDSSLRASLSDRILACLRRAGSLSLAELAERLPEEPAASLQAALLGLEVERRLTRDRAGRFGARSAEGE
ncbi:MAG: DNA-protecting protein DprA [Candidatus Eisenbacteria bacterium]|nr:DNA-protecting protein DprA [Candidatus Eisenbacteria bacterium]